MGIMYRYVNRATVTSGANVVIVLIVVDVTNFMRLQITKMKTKKIYQQKNMAVNEKCYYCPKLRGSNDFLKMKKRFQLYIYKKKIELLIIDLLV